MATNIEQWVKGYDASWSSQNVDKILSYYADDCVYEDMAIGKINKGKEEIRSFVSNLFTAVPDFKIETKSFFASNDQICIEAVISGTHEGNFPGFPPATGKSFAVKQAHIVRLRNDKAIRVTDYYDMASLMRQLGLLPAS